MLRTLPSASNKLAHVVSLDRRFFQLIETDSLVFRKQHPAAFAH